MFSGIIETLGTVTSTEQRDQALGLRIATTFPDLTLGESVAVNGVCLTVAEFDTTGSAWFYVSSETLDRTALGRIRQNHRVNLERASTPATKLSGHIVQGHVDAIAHLARIEPVGESHRITFRVPNTLRGYMVEKGSVALDGISLTLNAVSEPTPDGFEIDLMIIPHTWEHTTLGTLKPNDPVNIEVDVIAKYVESLIRYKGLQP